MQSNMIRFQTQIIRESLRCGTSPGSIELQVQFVKAQYCLVRNYLLKPQIFHCLIR